jgi:molybdopterin-guanine dinucleotide biosynthesis protein A
MNCYVLAGGRSRRMGRSKRALFLDRVLAAARGAFEDVIVVDRDFEGPHEFEGPVFGIEAALRHVQHDRCFVLAVDYPLITTAALAYLRDRGGVPIWRGKPQPLCAVWDVAMLPRIESRIAARQFDIRGLIADTIDESELRARFEGEPLLNVNTPENFEEFQRHERVLASR